MKDAINALTLRLITEDLDSNTATKIGNTIVALQQKAPYDSESRYGAVKQIQGYRAGESHG